MLVRLLCLFLFLSLLPARSPAQQSEGCLRGEGHFSRQVAGYTIRIDPHPEQDEFMSECLASISPADGEPLFRVQDYGLVLNSISGVDINADGQPDLVLEGYSGGAHCCWTYYIYELGEHPRLLKEIYNETTIQFENVLGTSQVFLKTADGRFDYFDGLCHACTVLPLVYLEFRGDKLQDISSRFWPEYQKQIDSAENELTPEKIERFRKSDGKNVDPFEAKPLVLRIVLSYLYGGKPDEAWAALKKYWPPSDYERIKALILKTRGAGFENRAS